MASDKGAARVARHHPSLHRAGLLAALLAAGCSWGLGECRGWDAKSREGLAEGNIVAAKRVTALAKKIKSGDTMERDGLADEITKEAKAISVRAEDARDRALVAQADHGYVPAEVDIDSDEDRVYFMAYAGQAQARDVRRRTLRKLPAKVIGGAARLVASAATAVVAELPWYVRWPLYAALGAGVVLLLLTALGAAAVRLRRLRRAVIQYDASIQRLPQAKRLEIASGHDLEREHARIRNRQARDAGVLRDGGGE